MIILDYVANTIKIKYWFRLNQTRVKQQMRLLPVVTGLENLVFSVESFLISSPALSRTTAFCHHTLHHSVLEEKIHVPQVLGDKHTKFLIIYLFTLLASYCSSAIQICYEKVHLNGNTAFLLICLVFPRMAGPPD